MGFGTEYEWKCRLVRWSGGCWGGVSLQEARGLICMCECVCESVCVCMCDNIWTCVYVWEKKITIKDSIVELQMALALFMYKAFEFQRHTHFLKQWSDGIQNGGQAIFHSLSPSILNALFKLSIKQMRISPLHPLCTACGKRDSENEKEMARNTVVIWTVLLWIFPLLWNEALNVYEYFSSLFISTHYTCNKINLMRCLQLT